MYIYLELKRFLKQRVIIAGLFWHISCICIQHGMEWVLTIEFLSHKLTMYLQIILQLFLVVNILEIGGKRFFSRCLNNKLASMKNFLFCTIVFPNGIVVCSIFWYLYYVNRELVYSEEFDAYFSKWHNHVGHTLVLLPIVLELFRKSRALKIYPDYKIACFVINLLAGANHVWLVPIKLF